MRFLLILWRNNTLSTSQSSSLVFQIHYSSKIKHWRLVRKPLVLSITADSLLYASARSQAVFAIKIQRKIYWDISKTSYTKWTNIQSKVETKRAVFHHRLSWWDRLILLKTSFWVTSSWLVQWVDLQVKTVDSIVTMVMVTNVRALSVLKETWFKVIITRSSDSLQVLSYLTYHLKRLITVRAHFSFTIRHQTSLLTVETALMIARISSSSKIPNH